MKRCQEKRKLHLWNIYQSLLDSISALRSEIKIEVTLLNSFICYRDIVPTLENVQNMTVPRVKKCTSKTSFSGGQTILWHTCFQYYVSHIFNIPVLQVFITYPTKCMQIIGWKYNICQCIGQTGQYSNHSRNGYFSASLYVFGDTSPLCDFSLPKAKWIQRAIMSCQKLIERNGSLHRLLWWIFSVLN